MATTIKFIKNEVTLFLAKSYPYAAKCFGEDFVGKESVTSDEVQKWFQRYFLSSVGYDVYRSLEKQVKAYEQIKN